MKMLDLLFALLVAGAMASCPNDCSQHGKCNIHSACLCYRNWMGADCSLRQCYFSHAFIDTPQGDLNSDGRVDRPDVHIITVKSSQSFVSGTAQPDYPIFPANQYVRTSYCENKVGNNLGCEAHTSETECVYDFLCDYSGAGTPPCTAKANAADFAITAPASDLSNAGIVIQQSSAVDIDGKVGYKLAVVTNDGNAPSLESSSATNPFPMPDGACLVIADVAGATSTSSAYAFFDQSATPLLKVRTYSAAATAAESYLYNTQFTNKRTWELYPKNHGWANQMSESPSLKSFYDEAHFYSECSGKGSCDRSTGECECYDGYEGEGCTRTACPNACSGHGVCVRLGDLPEPSTQWDRHKTQQCVCDAGYTNPDCSGRECKSGDDPITRPEAGTLPAVTDTYNVCPDRDSSGAWSEVATGLASPCMDYVLGTLETQSPEVHHFGYTSISRRILGFPSSSQMRAVINGAQRP